MVMRMELKHQVETDDTKLTKVSTKLSLSKSKNNSDVDLWRKMEQWWVTSYSIQGSDSGFCIIDSKIVFLMMKNLLYSKW